MDENASAKKFVSELMEEHLTKVDKDELDDQRELLELVYCAGFRSGVAEGHARATTIRSSEEISH